LVALGYLRSITLPIASTANDHSLPSLFAFKVIPSGLARALARHEALLQRHGRFGQCLRQRGRVVLSKG
jgi:hypothetical protein